MSFGSHTCTGCHAELMGYLVGPEPLTNCPKCGAPLDASSVALAQATVRLFVFGGLPLMFGGAAGLLMHFVFFPRAESIIPGAVIGASVWLLSLSGLILIYTGRNRINYLLLLLGAVGVAALGGGIWFLVWGR